MDKPSREQLTIRLDPARDHYQGTLDAEFVLVAYGDFECPFSARAAVRVSGLQRRLGTRLCFVFRHLPLNDKHPHAQLAAEASEAAAAQGKFWNLYRVLLTHQEALRQPDLLRYARLLELDVERFTRDLDDHRWEQTVRLQAEGARMLGATGTPSFFIDGRLYDGPYEPEDLQAALLQQSARD